MLSGSGHHLKCPPLPLWASIAEELFIKFAKPERLRSFRLCLFTGRAVTVNDILLPLAPCGSIRASNKRCYSPYVLSRSDYKSAEHKKSSSEAAWIFCMEPFFFGVTRGVWGY